MCKLLFWGDLRYLGDLDFRVIEIQDTGVRFGMRVSAHLRLVFDETSVDEGCAEAFGLGTTFSGFGCSAFGGGRWRFLLHQKL